MMISLNVNDLKTFFVCRVNSLYINIYKKRERGRERNERVKEEAKQIKTNEDKEEKETEENVESFLLYIILNFI